MFYFGWNKIFDELKFSGWSIRDYFSKKLTIKDSVKGVALGRNFKFILNSLKIITWTKICWWKKKKKKLWRIRSKIKEKNMADEQIAKF